MRNAVAVLLALNFLCALWFWVRPSAAAPDIQAQLPAGESLRLMAAGELLECTEWGPFTDEDLLTEITEALFGAQSGREAAAWRVIARDAPVSVRHRVYVPPLPGRAEAQQQLVEVRAAIAASGAAIDSYLVLDGELMNAVSLGLFADPANAGRVHDALFGQPFEVLIRDEVGLRTEYWLRVEAEKTLDLKKESEIWALYGEYLASLEQNVCEMIAQPD